MPTRKPFISEASGTDSVGFQKELQSIFDRKEFATPFLFFFYMTNNLQIRESLKIDTATVYKVQSE